VYVTRNVSLFSYSSSSSSKLTTRSEGVLEYWSTVPVFELHLATARLGMLKGRQICGTNSLFV
jgi:hypothetical protein